MFETCRKLVSFETLEMLKLIEHEKADSKLDQHSDNSSFSRVTG